MLFRSKRLLSVREEVESYGTDSVHTIELVSELVEIDIEIMDELVQKLGTIEKACTNAVSTKGEITPTKAYKLNLLGEILKRRTCISEKEKPQITSPDRIANLYMQEYKYLEVEYFDILVLNTKNRIIKKVNISKGLLNVSLARPREIFKEALKHNANSIILIHNHPSGDVKPSKEDIDITNRIVDAGNIIGIKVLDHLIFGDNRYLSFKEKNLL